MTKSDFETSIVNGFHTILREVQLIENGVTPPLQGGDVLEKMFDRKGAGSGQKWRFFDDIVVKYLESVTSEEGKNSQGERLACAIVVVCLSEFDEFLRFIFDIYGSGGDGQITLQDYTDVLRTILPANTDESTLEEHVSSFSLYAAAHPLSLSQAEDDCGTEKSDVQVFPKAVALHYHTKSHKQLLWPLKVAQEQVKMKFLGVNYWTGLHEEMVTSHDTSALYLPCQAKDFSTFVDSLLSLFSAHMNVSKLPTPAPPPPSGSDSPTSGVQEITETDGIYTYRHKMSIGVGRMKHASSRNPVHLHSPIDHVLRDTSIAFEGRRYPVPKQSLGDSSEGSLMTRSMANLNILIIEDSKLQRKMMHHRLVKASACVKEEHRWEGLPVSRSDSGSLLLPPPPPGCAAAVVEDGLGEKGWIVKETTTGEEAIQMIIDTKSSFDVIFVDENLSHGGGHMLGHEFVSILRGHSSVLPTTVIIGCSANAEVYVSNFLEAGADAVWQKPMRSPAVIHTEICKYIITRSKYTRL